MTEWLESLRSVFGFEMPCEVAAGLCGQYEVLRIVGPSCYGENLLNLTNEIVYYLGKPRGVAPEILDAIESIADAMIDDMADERGRIHLLLKYYQEINQGHVPDAAYSEFCRNYFNNRLNSDFFLLQFVSFDNANRAKLNVWGKKILQCMDERQQSAALLPNLENLEFLAHHRN